MAKKKKQDKETTIVDYYDLKIDKVDELVEALKTDKVDESKPVSTKVSDCTGTDTPDTKTKRGKDKEFDPYKVDKFSRIPAWLKALFIKWWFAGMVCYFVITGLGTVISDDLDRLVLAGVVLGLVVDVIVNPIFRFMESSDKEYNNYIMFPFPIKQFWTFFTNIIYYVGVTVAVMYIYRGLNLLGDVVNGTPNGEAIHLGVEPLLYALFILIIDMALIGIKDLIVYLVKRKKHQKAEMLAIQKEIDGVAGDADAANGEANGQPVAEGQKSANIKAHKGNKKGRK